MSEASQAQTNESPEVEPKHARKHKSRKEAASVPEEATAATETREPGDDTYSERKKYPPIPDPFGIATDNLVGVRLFESRRDRQMAIQFGEGKPEAKPSEAVLGLLKEHGYRWNGQHKIWAKPVCPQDAMQTRIEAERLYQEVTKLIREERGLSASQEATPF